jgi:hypothetical protein
MNPENQSEFPDPYNLINRALTPEKKSTRKRTARAVPLGRINVPAVFMVGWLNVFKKEVKTTQ